MIYGDEGSIDFSEGLQTRSAAQSVEQVITNADAADLVEDGHPQDWRD